MDSRTWQAMVHRFTKSQDMTEPLHFLQEIFPTQGLKLGLPHRR